MMGSGPPAPPPNMAAVELLSELVSLLRASNLEAKLAELKNYAVEAREAAAALAQEHLAHEAALKAATQAQAALEAHEEALVTKESYLAGREAELEQAKSDIAHRRETLTEAEQIVVELKNKANADIATARAATNRELAVLRENAAEEVASSWEKAQREIQDLHASTVASLDKERDELQRREIAVAALEHRIAERTEQLRAALGQ